MDKYFPNIRNQRFVTAADWGAYYCNLFTECESPGLTNYEHVLFVHDLSDDDLVLAVASEVNQGAVDHPALNMGSHFLGLFPGQGHLNMGASNDWADLDLFAARAFSAAREHLGLPSSPPPEQAADEGMHLEPPHEAMQYYYMRAKAERFIAVGPEEYRQSDHFHFPPAGWSAPRLRRLHDNCHKLMTGEGAHADQPLRGIHAGDVHDMASLFHFRCLDHRLRSSDIQGQAVYRMHLRHRVMMTQAALYHEPSPPAGPCSY